MSIRETAIRTYGGSRSGAAVRASLLTFPRRKKCRTLPGAEMAINLPTSKDALKAT
jgi:hypothetical protein